MRLQALFFKIVFRVFGLVNSGLPPSSRLSALGLTWRGQGTLWGAVLSLWPYPLLSVSQNLSNWWSPGGPSPVAAHVDGHQYLCLSRQGQSQEGHRGAEEGGKGLVWH